jgi:iron complex outermembrane receptor protein
VGKVRGFPAQYSVSGISSLRCAFGVDSAFIERIEVFKGPGGMVGGVADNGGRGGVINVVRKRPRPGWQYEVTGSASSQDDGTLRSTFDVGAGDDGTHWRLVGYGTRSGRTDGGYSARHGGGLLGAISQHGDDFSATLTWQHDHRRETPPAMSRWAWTFGVPPVIEEGRQTPVSKDDGTSLRFSDAELDAEWRLSSAWRLRGKARWGRGNMDARRHQYSPDQMGAWFDRYDTRFSDNARQWTLVGDVLTGPLKHKLLLGADAQVQRVVSGWQNAGWFVDPEVFVPGRSELPPTDAGEPLVERTRYTQKGVLLQDQVSIGPVQLRLAMRRTAFSDVYDVLGAEELRNVTGKSWEAGAAYQLTPSTVVYAGVQSALEAAYDHGITLFDGSIAPPHRSRQSQAGMKFGPLDGRLSVTLEAYRIKRLGAIGYGMDNEAWVVPSEYSRGIELEATGRPSAALDLAFGVNLISAREHLPANQQVEPYRVPTAATPPRSMHLLGRYRLPEGLVRDTSIGMALRAYSDTWVQAPDPEGMVWSQRIPGGARLDLSWTRRFGNGSFAVSVFNVFDRRLYGASTNTEFVPVLPGRSLSVMLAFKG